MDKKFLQSTCNKSVDNLQQTCHQRAVTSHANTSWCWPAVTRCCKMSVLQRTELNMVQFKEGRLWQPNYDSCLITEHSYEGPNPSCQHSLWEETRVPGENPRLSVGRWLTLFTEVSRVWTEDQTHDLRDERRLLWRLRGNVVFLFHSTHNNFKAIKRLVLTLLYYKPIRTLF